MSVGMTVKWFRPIHPVMKGKNESQKSRCRLAHMTPPVARRAALSMFPDKELAYDLIYRPRLQRLMNERFRLQ